MVKLVVSALFLIFGTHALRADDVVCPPTQIFIATEEGPQAIRPRAKHMPEIIATIKDIFKIDPSCMCVLKIAFHSSGRADYVCQGKR